MEYTASLCNLCIINVFFYKSGSPRETVNVCIIYLCEVEQACAQALGMCVVEKGRVYRGGALPLYRLYYSNI